MSDRYLVSVTTPGYVAKTGRYLNSVGYVRSAKTVCVLLDFTEKTDPNGQIEAALREVYDWIDYRRMPLPPTHSFFMVQHGKFLQALPDVADDALLCLSDMDVELQRDISPEEWTSLEGLSSSRLSATWNAGVGDNLLFEAERLGLTLPWQGVTAEEASQIPCMNCGLVAGRVKAFRDLEAYYESLCDSFYAATQHRSRCQWLINYCVHRFMGGWELLPPALHVHGHFKIGDDYLLPKGTEVRRRLLFRDGVAYVFKHAF